MKKTTFTEAQVVFALRQADTGVTVAEVCRKRGISEAPYDNWKKKYGGLGVSGLRRLKPSMAQAKRSMPISIIRLNAGVKMGRAWPRKTTGPAASSPGYPPDTTYRQDTMPPYHSPSSPECKLLHQAMHNLLDKELSRELGIPARVLTRELQEMEANKLVARTVHDAHPVTAEYAATTYGGPQRPVAEALRRRGLLHHQAVGEAAWGEQPGGGGAPQIPTFPAG